MTETKAESRRLQTNLRRRLTRAEKALIASDHRLAAWIQQCGKCRLEVFWQRSIFEALARAVAHQQLHGKAAASILRRLVAAYPGADFPRPQQLADTPIEVLRGFGFSASKAQALHGIAAAAERGEIPDRQQASRMTDEQLIASLVPLRGVGRWTVEMILIFTLGRLDVMPHDDFGVRAGLQHLHALPQPPKARDFAALTAHWQPHRSVAAWYLWRLADARKPQAGLTNQANAR